jgi:hypothetical protein
VRWRDEKYRYLYLGSEELLAKELGCPEATGASELSMPSHLYFALLWREHSAKAE